MGWWRRRNETLNERLMREAGLLAETEAPSEPLEPLEPERRYPFVSHDFALTEGVPPRPRRWDAVVTAEAPEIEGDEVSFVALPDGTLIVEEERGDKGLDPLADAVEAELARPYRAKGVRKSSTIWAVSATSIRIVEFVADGDEIQLTSVDGERTLSVDGSREFGSIPVLEQIGEETGSSYVIRASRVDGNLWEVKAASL